MTETARNLFSLEGKVALVTGASRGIGEAMALAMAEAGSDIVAVSRTESSGLKAAVEKAGQAYAFVSADLTDVTTVPALFQKAVDSFGALDILVNNAGIIRRSPATDFTEKDWDDVMNVNLKVPFQLCQAFARHILERGVKGKIINTASMLSFQGGILVASYTASKSALSGLTRLLANEWAGKGINVNAVAPGYIRTENTRALQENSVRNEQILARIPHGRWGEPEDLKGITIFLASKASDYVDGYTIAVDGGWMAR